MATSSREVAAQWQRIQTGRCGVPKKKARKRFPSGESGTFFYDYDYYDSPELFEQRSNDVWWLMLVPFLPLSFVIFFFREIRSLGWLLTGRRSTLCLKNW